MRKLLKSSSFALLSFVCAGVVPAAAQDKCGPLKRAAQIDMLPDGAGRPMIPVTMAGKRKYLLLDTGAYVSVLNRATVKELGLGTQEANVRITGIDGKSSEHFTRVPELIIGGLRAKNHAMMVQPGDDGEISDTDFVGVLGPEVLRAYDSDFDFAAAKFSLFDQDHCKGKVVYWTSTEVPVAIVPFRLNKSNHITFPLLVDGKRLTAMLDTGASGTVMSLSVARRMFGLTADSPDVERVGELEGAIYTGATYRRRFNKIEIEGLSIANPMIELLPDMVTPNAPAEPPIGSRIVQPDDRGGLSEVILGMSVLRDLHLYIAYKERKLYITQATPASTVSP